ncbi:MFS transporter [Paenibacillus sp. N1-5-1-14]|uniref:MFS transporter n=1 Tax=Paenibacillus radicibacter TaxID=2972488 RepID=UPI002158FE20|nr:MFS transporter [Paenibacillus radicibacter]MCR8643882.1 MFS transporter [Paenibacillus radicibacter]
MVRSNKLMYLILFTFVVFFSQALINTFFPLYFDSKGWSKTQIGVLTSLGPMIGMFSTIGWGIASDRMRTIKKIMMILLIGQFALTIFLLQTDQFAFIIPLMAIFFFFQQPMIPLNDTNLMLSAGTYGKNYASLRIWGSLGFSFASVVFGQLTNSFGANITIYLSLIVTVIIFIFLIPVQDTRGSSKKMQFKGMFRILFNSKMVVFLVLVFVMSLAHRTNDAFLAVFLREHGAPNSLIGYAWMLSATSEIAAFFYLSKYGHKYKELALLTIAALMYGVRLTLVGFTTNPYGLVATQLMHSVTFGIFLVTALRYMQSIIPDEYRATGQAVFSAVWTSAAGLVSGLVGGWIYDSWGGSTLFRIAAVCGFVAAIGFATANVLSNRNNGQYSNDAN